MTRTKVLREIRLMKFNDTYLQRIACKLTQERAAKAIAFEDIFY